MEEDFVYIFIYHNLVWHKTRENTFILNNQHKNNSCSWKYNPVVNNGLNIKVFIECFYSTVSITYW